MADILSQEEIEALLDVVEEESYEIDNKYKYVPQRQITLYDFKRPNRISKNQLIYFRKIHDIFTRSVVVDLSKELRGVVELQLHSVDQMKYTEFLMLLPSPTLFNVATLNPLPHS